MRSIINITHFATNRLACEKYESLPFFIVHRLGVYLEFKQRPSKVE